MKYQETPLLVGLNNQIHLRKNRGQLIFDQGVWIQWCLTREWMESFYVYRVLLLLLECCLSPMTIFLLLNLLEFPSCPVLCFEQTHEEISNSTDWTRDLLQCMHARSASDYLKGSSSSPWSDGIWGGIPGDGCLGGVAVLAAGRCAVRTDNIFPFEIIYTEQKSGADFITVVDISTPLNFLWIKKKQKS